MVGLYLYLLISICRGPGEPRDARGSSITAPSVSTLHFHWQLPATSSQGTTMYSRLLDLPNELLIHILSLVCLGDISDVHSCQLTCRALNTVINESTLIQYLLHTALLGVYDPLVPDDNAPPFSERFNTLRAWDAAWRALDLTTPITSFTADFPRPASATQMHFSFGPWFIVATREGPGVRAGYAYLDVRACFAAPAGPHLWTSVDVPVPNVEAFALSTELDLAVVISAERDRRVVPDSPSRLEIRPLRFRDGMQHPCAKAAVMEITVSGASAHNMAQTQVLGDFLLLWIGGPSEEDYSLCKVFLIAWKEGRVTLLRENDAGEYGSIPTMISADVFALVRLNPPAIELCRISGMASAEPRMERLRALCLPPLREGAVTDWAVCVSEHPGHQAFSRGPWAPYRRAAPRRQFRIAAEDSIVSVVMQLRAGAEHRVRICDVVVRCRTLLAHAHAGADVPWAEWGPLRTRMTDHLAVVWNDLLGERRAMVCEPEGSRPTIRIQDFNAHRVREARMRKEKGADDACTSPGASEADNHTEVVTGISEFAAGEWFCEDVKTSLPYVDTWVKKPGCKAIYMEQDQLLVQMQRVRARTPHGATPMLMAELLSDLL
ncbi:hypothetical protein BC834DRAFT_435730 [Gloeopeniophorella convolvens]|nr:hypothetical protein BC834DRAFT_435730 [Gloeopeniophorella convolvens]